MINLVISAVGAAALLLCIIIGIYEKSAERRASRSQRRTKSQRKEEKRQCTANIYAIRIPEARR